MNNIFNIQQEYLDLMNQIEENEGELTPELEEQLAINIDSFEDKMRAYANVVSQLKGDSNMISDEIARLKALQTTKDNLQSRLKATMRDAMELYGDRGKSGNFVLDLGDMKFYTRKNEVVTISDEGMFKAMNRDYVKVSIPQRFTKKEYDAIKLYVAEHIYNGELPEDFKFEYHIDKRMLKEDLKNKVEIDGVQLTRNDSLIIK